MNRTITAAGSFVAGIVATFATAMLLVPDLQPNASELSLADCAHDRLLEYAATSTPDTQENAEKAWRGMLAACLEHPGAQTQEERTLINSGLDRALSELRATQTH